MIPPNYIPLVNNPVFELSGVGVEPPSYTTDPLTDCPLGRLGRQVNAMAVKYRKRAFVHCLVATT